MSIRLRRMAPRRRRRTRLTPILTLLFAVFGGMLLLGMRADANRPRVRIEFLQAHQIVRATPVVSSELPSLPPLAPPGPVLTDNFVVAYYGNPLAEVLGVLGEQSPADTVRRLRTQADAYQRLLGSDTKVVPTMYLIYAVAQKYTDDDNTYLFHIDDALVDEYVRLTRDNDMLLILDIQMGKSTVEKEVPRVFKWLKEPHVHLGLDPEFAWEDDAIPGYDIGHMTGDEINRAQRMVQQFTMDERLPTKILVVHQFLRGMIRDKAAIKSYDRVELVIDADGVGARHVKQGSWDRVIVEDGVQRPAVKLFYKHDPDIWQPEDVLKLQPRPVMVIYQ